MPKNNTNITFDSLVKDLFDIRCAVGVSLFLSRFVTGVFSLTNLKKLKSILYFTFTIPTLRKKCLNILNILNRCQVTITDAEEKNYILHPCLSLNQSFKKLREKTFFILYYFAKKSLVAHHLWWDEIAHPPPAAL